MFMVSSTGTFVKRDSTSMVVIILDGREALIMSRTSCVEFRLCDTGVNGAIRSLRHLAKV